MVSLPRQSNPGTGTSRKPDMKNPPAGGFFVSGQAKQAFGPTGE